MTAPAIKALLLVEDNPGDARLIAEMFNEQALQIATLTHVSSMGDAEKKLLECDFDLILLDLGLPDAGGLEAVRRAHAAAPRTPLVVLTGMDDETLAAQTLQEGAQDYLIKGEIETGALLRALRYAVGRKMTEETARALTQAKEDFLASMSHELRTPLNAIIGFSGLMVDSGALQPTELRYAQLIQQASGSLLSIINDVLDVSKINAGSLGLDPQLFSPAVLVENAAELVRAEAEAKGVDLQIAADPALPPLLVGDDKRLRQIVINLLSNAIKFTAKGFVRLSAAPEGMGDPGGARVRFTVADSGIGIPRAKRHLLFKRFSQIDSSTSREFGGTGLGLSICKSLVEIMGGTIEVESEEGSGSNFSFVIDFRLAEPDMQSRSAVAIAAPGENGIRVLLAEDAPMNQELMVALLTGWGYKVDVAADGAGAVDAVSRAAYDIVLMDIQMPVMDGVEATQRIRALGRAHATLPILAVTANILDRDVARFLASGMNGHVGKPIVPKALRMAMENCLSAGTATDPPDHLLAPRPPAYVAPKAA